MPGVFSSLIFVSPYIRTVKTASGAMAVQVVFSERKGAKRMKHIGSAHSESELALLRAEAQRIVDGDQLAMDFGEATHTPPATGSVSNPLPVVGQRAGYLLDCIDACFNELGLAAASGCRFGVVGTASPRSWYRCSVYPVLQGVFFHS